MEERNSQGKEDSGGIEIPGDLPGSVGEGGAGGMGGAGDVGGEPLFMGDFRIIRKIGSGGMAKVYEAVQVSLNRTVALKILPSDMSASEKMVLLFQREAEAAGRQHHPGIVAVYTAGEHGGLHYIAEELVPDGRTLATELMERRIEPDLPRGYFRRAAEIAVAVADALKHAHELKVFHRDVKPSNILLTADGTPKVTDFGLAKVEDALSLSQTGELMGTPYYMSPEQAVSRRVGIDHRTDIYSLGVTLYEMLTLQKPFKGSTSHEVLQQVISIEPKDPRKLNLRVPRELAVICLKAMEKDAIHRYQTMAEFADDLRRFIDCEEIHARPAPSTRKAWKFVRRHPAKSAAAAVAFAALLILGANTFWSWTRLKAEERKTIAVNDFLAHLFSASDPDHGGMEMLVVDALAEASLKVDRAFAEEPEIRAALRTEIGTTYAALGAYDRALEADDKAPEITGSLHGAEYPGTIELKRNRAVVLIGLGRHSEAEKPLLEILDVARLQGGGENTEALIARDALATVFWRTGRFEKAEELHRDILETRRRLLPPDDPLTLKSMSNLGCFLVDRDDLSGAEPLLRSVLEKRRRVLGESHTNTLQSINNLACLYERWEDFPRAVALYREAIEIQSRVLPEGHDDILSSKNNLASLLAIKGDQEEAVTLCQEVLKSREKSLGEFHPATLQSKNNLALSLHEAGEFAAARALFEEIIRTAGLNSGTEYPELTLWEFNLAELLIDLGEHAGAEKLCRKIVDDRRGVHGESHLLTLEGLDQLARVLFLQGRAPDAVRVVQPVIRSTGGVLPIGTAERMMLHATCARCLIAMRRYGEAEPHALDFYLGAKTRRYPQKEEALRLLVDLYGGWEKTDKLAEYEDLLRNLDQR